MEDEQIHPLHDIDKQIVDSLIVKKSPEDNDLINLARLILRYEKFPGEKALISDLEKTLNFWQMSKEKLFSETRKIWSKDFRPINNITKDLIGSGFDTTTNISK